MTKYILGLGALVAVLVGYVLLMPTEDAPTPAPAPVATAPAPEPAPAVTAPVAPLAIAPRGATPASAGEEVLLEEMAADARESLPSAMTDTLTLSDALFLPRMRIMEYRYITTAADPRAAAGEMRGLIEARAETICLEGREMFEMGVTLRNSFEDRDGILVQRVYLLPEDCRRFY